MGAIAMLGAWNRRNFTILAHRVFITGAAGAIASQDAAVDSGCTASRISAGQYKIQTPFFKGVRVFHGAWCTIIGPDSTSPYSPIAGGVDGCIRLNKVDLASGNTPDGSFLWQFARGDTNVDAELDATEKGFTVFIAVSQ